jgi:dTDP-4-dehydrorhamnose 3,5-epimerase
MDGASSTRWRSIATKQSAGDVKFTESKLSGAWQIDLERRDDERGFFARAFCADEFAAHGIVNDVKQANISMGTRGGTMRGIHFQYPPATESKFIRCISGAIFDVVVDLRPESPTFLQHDAFELTAANRSAVVVPPRFGHAFLSLVDHSEVLYMVSEFYTPAEEGGLRWDDPALAITWPMTPTVVSEKDQVWRPMAEQLEKISTKMHPDPPIA